MSDAGAGMSGIRPASKTGRFGGIDMLRGIAALMVITQHAAEHSGLIANERIGGLNLGRMGVVTFFAISGFVIPMSLERQRDPINFIIGRIFRIYPLFLTCLIIALLYHRFHFPLYSIIAQVLLISPFFKIPDIVGNSWTLSLEMIWYFGILLQFTLNMQRFIVIPTTIICCTMIAGVCGVILGYNIPLGWIGFFGSCVLGLLAYRLREGTRRATIVKCIVAIYLSVIIGVFVERLKFPRHGEPSEVGQIITWTFSYVLFFLALMWNDDKPTPRVLKFFGTISYSLYLVHTFVFIILINIGFKGITYFVLVFILSIPLAAFAQRYIEIPTINIGKKIIQYKSEKNNIYPNLY